MVVAGGDWAVDNVATWGLLCEQPIAAAAAMRERCRRVMGDPFFVSARRWTVTSNDGPIT